MSHTFGLSPGLMLGMMLALATPAPTLAQAMVQPIPGTTDADRLGEQMRALAVNANDVNALITAGELSLKLDDLTAAASLFARAEKVDPRNPRLRAGEASVLVRSERPGEALRYFAQAQAMGLDPARFASDRGLAYDLIGEQERAQREYRLALHNGPDEEVTRRYALSLGISGKRDLALEQLDPLLRETDRGAWRARAFVLAMAGDLSGAERIATTMMPPGMAEGLQPFFQRLPSLPAIDRAFAVHFGEVRATPDRLADARLAPPMAALGPDPYAPVMVARAAPVAVAEQQGRQDKKRKKDKQKAGRVELAAAVVPSRIALPPPPAYTGQPVAIYEPAPRPSAPMSATARANAQQLATIRADMYPTQAVPTTTPSPSRGGRTVTLASATRTMPTPSAPVQTRPAAAPIVATVQPSLAQSPVRTATVQPVPAQSPAQTASAQPSAVRETTEAARTPAPTPGFSSTMTTAATTVPATATSAPVDVAATPTKPSSAPVMATPTPSAPVPQPEQIAAVTPTTAAPTPAPIVAATARVFATSEPAATVPVATPRPEPALPVTGARDSADTILARIIAGLSIPESELTVLPIRASSTPATNVVAQAKAKEARDAAAEKLVVDQQAATKLAAEQAAADKLAADKKAAADKKKAALDKKALAAKKIADDKKAADAKAAADAKKLARANPARIWVQVSGGANEGDLPKAYAAVRAKAPAVFAGKSGWSTPLRATNRVLAGPFKTDAEARSFVNSLAKAGVSAFTFTSDEGQQVTRLPAK